MTLTIALLEDYPVLVAGLRTLLEPHADRVRVGVIDVFHPDLLGVDVVLRDGVGFDPGAAQLEHTTGRGPRPKVLLLTGSTDIGAAAAGLACGADGVVAKTASAAELVDAVERVHRGDRVVPGHQDGVEAYASGRWPGDHDGLSARQSQVLSLICRGLGNREVAAAMRVSQNTVKTYVRSTYDKIGVTTRPQAVIWGLNRGFAEVSRGP